MFFFPIFKAFKKQNFTKKEYELQKGSGGYINEGAYLVDLDKVTNITADKNVEYITIGDNTRKGTIVVVLATDTARVAFLVTVK